MKRKRPAKKTARRAGTPAKIARLQEELRLANAKFAGVVGIAADAIIAIDDAQRIVLFNHGAEQIFGYAPNEIIGQPLTVLLPEGVRGAHTAHVLDFEASAVNARHMGARRTIQGRRRSGEIFPAEASISKVDLGKTKLYTAVLRDVTDRARLLKAEQLARATAEAAVRARDGVLAVVSHDLRNPLSAIAMCSTTLLEQPPEDVKVRNELLSMIGQSVDWMNRIIQDLLDIASIEAGKLSIYIESTDVRSLIAQARPTLDALAASHRLEVTVAEGLPPVSADAERIAQVLANLVGNAAKFTPPGGVIKLHAAREPGMGVCISVRDEGSGISAADLPHIFDRFWHARGSSVKRGNGLGLAISMGIVHAHSGMLWAESDAGHGAAFHFTLPEDRQL